jgi:hypothetical protein
VTEPTSGPFITPMEQYTAGSKSPKAIGQMKLNGLNLRMDMTDAEMDAVFAQAKALRDTYNQWEAFYNDLELRRRRYLGFQAVVLALDVTAAAAAMHTTPQAITAVMQASAAQEKARLDELQALWDSGQLPDRPVLTDPSADVVSGSDIDPDATV